MQQYTVKLTARIGSGKKWHWTGNKHDNTWTNSDPFLRRDMASLGHNEFTFGLGVDMLVSACMLICLHVRPLVHNVIWVHIIALMQNLKHYH